MFEPCFPFGANMGRGGISVAKPPSNPHGSEWHQEAMQNLEGFYRWLEGGGRLVLVELASA